MSGQVEMGGALLSGGLRSFGLLHCGIRSRRHCGARMAAPGARYSNRREREGRTALGTPSASWCYSCSVLGSNLEWVIELAIVRNEINSRSCDEKRIYIKF